MTEWDFDQRLKELERKALFRKMNIGAFKQMSPAFFFIFGSTIFLMGASTAVQFLASLCFVCGSWLMMFTSSMK